MVTFLMIIILVIPILGLGLFFIIGSLKNVDFLVNYQNYGIFSWSYYLLNKIGPNAIKIFHISIGIGMLFLSIKILLYVIK